MQSRYQRYEARGLDGNYDSRYVQVRKGHRIGKSAAHKDTPAMKGLSSTVEFLLASGARLDMVNRDGWNALHLAAKEGI